MFTSRAEPRLLLRVDTAVAFTPLRAGWNWGASFQLMKYEEISNQAVFRELNGLALKELPHVERRL